MILNGARGAVEVRAKDWPGWVNYSGQGVPPATWRASGGADGVPAAGRAVRIAAEAVAAMDFDVWRGEDANRREVTGSWQARFFEAEPNQRESWFDVWDQTESSLTAENNAYWWLSTLDGRVVGVQVVDPRLVAPKWDASGAKMFAVQTAKGRRDVGEETILHFRGSGAPGAAAAPNPIDRYIASFSAAVNRQEYEEGFYERGLGQMIAVTLPANMDVAQAAELRDALSREHGGSANAHRPLVLGGGVTDIKTIGVSPRDAQFIEAMQWTVFEVSRIYSIFPVSLLDGGDVAQKSLSAEMEQTRWLTWSLTPRLKRIEQAVKRHPAFFGGASRDYPMFQADGFIRADLATANTIQHEQIMDGRLLVDEARAQNGLAPLPNGAGQVPVINPAGAGATPDQFLPKTTPEPAAA